MKSKKSALLLSFTSLLICFAMLVGSTFAWFTDTATTGVNRIVSGKLKVDIVDGTTEQHLEKLSFQNKESSDNILWEPGVTFLTQGFKIKNDGNLALKWKMTVNKGVKGETDQFDLKDVIDFSVVTSTAENAEAVRIEDFVGHLTKETTSDDTYYIKAHMQETAGNDYQNLTLDGITITVYATQDTVEYDSFDNQYDKYAQYGERTVKNEALVNRNGEFGLTDNNAANVKTKNVTYSIPAGNYEGKFFAQHFGINSTFEGNGATFESMQLEGVYVQNVKNGVKTNEESTLIVSNFNVEGDLIITAGGDQGINNVIINNCTAKHITVRGVKNDTSVTIDGCKITGTAVDEVKGNNKYGVYILRDETEGTAKVSIINSEFSGIKGHAIAVQSSGATCDFTITGNTFTSYGLGNEENRAAFKIWGDSKLDPTVVGEEKVLNEAAKALAAEIKAKNTFGVDLDENCVVADFFGKSVSFTD